MIIAVAVTKGGAAKTTSAMYLAEAFARKGYEVKLYDNDPQGTLSSWYDISQDYNESAAEEDRDIWKFEVVPINQSKIGRLRNDETIKIIDCSPDPQAVQAAIKKADFTVLPTSPSEVELDQLIASFETLGVNQEEDDYRVLINRVQTSSTAYDDAVKTLDENEIQHFKINIPSRVSIPRSFGAPIDGNLHGYQFVVEEIEELQDLEMIEEDEE